MDAKSAGPAESVRAQEIRMLLASRREAERKGDRAGVEYCDRQLAELRATPHLPSL